MWPTSGQGRYITPAAWGVPTASERGAQITVAHKWARWLHNPYLRDPHRFSAGGKSGPSEVAHKWARWLHHPCRLGDPHRFSAGGKIRSGPQMGKVATSPTPPRGSPPPKSEGEKQKCPKKGGYATSPLHYGGSIAKGTKPKVAELGARTKLWMCSPKEYHQEKNRKNDVSASKNTLKTPLGPLLKRGGGFKTPHAIRFLTNPSALA